MQQFAVWLQKLGLGQYAHRFSENDIDFAVLADLTDQDLEKIGVASLGHRRKLLRAIAALKGALERTTIAVPITLQDAAERQRLWVTRRFRIKVVLAVLYVLCAGARLHAHEGEGHFSAGEPGDPNKPFRVVEITMQESNGTMSYRPKALEVRRGEQIKFVITNAGVLAHEFILANTADNLKHAALMKKYPDMEHDDPNGKTVQPSAKAEVLWRFTKTGTFEFSCLIPGHREAGMVGTVTVK
jgi:uncharacterized cupredoxin-like copper-binding protein